MVGQPNCDLRRTIDLGRRVPISDFLDDHNLVQTRARRYEGQYGPVGRFHAKMEGLGIHRHIAAPDRRSLYRPRRIPQALLEQHNYRAFCVVSGRCFGVFGRLWIVTVQLPVRVHEKLRHLFFLPQPDDPAASGFGATLPCAL